MIARARPRPLEGPRRARSTRSRRTDIAVPSTQPPTATCNIGPAELRRRRQSAVMAALALVAAVVAIAVGVLPRWALPVLAPLFGAVAGTALQVRMRFCMAFGLAGVVGMGEDPGFEAADPAFRAAHRRKAVLMLSAAGLAAVAWAVVTSLAVILAD